jgi:hypothetical protein
MGWKRVILGLILLLFYLGAASAFVYLSYALFPPTNTDQYKEFGVRAGIALAAVGAFFGFAVSFFTLSTQIKAAKDLANHQSVIVEKIEKLKGEITKRINFLNQALSAQSTAYDKLFVASENCYRELQNLNTGTFDANRIAKCERALNEAAALGANLPKEDQRIVTEIVQGVLNLADLAKQVKGSTDEKKIGYEAIWKNHSTKLGDAIESFRNRSLFQNENLREGGLDDK